MIVSRLMLGDLYGCIGIYSTPETAVYDIIASQAERDRVETELESLLQNDIGYKGFKNADIAIHAIKDVNKTQRQIRAVTENGNVIEIGEPTCRVLVGIFFKNVHLSMLEIKPYVLEQWKVRRLAREQLQRIFEDTLFDDVALYGETSNAIE